MFLKSNENEINHTDVYCNMALTLLYYMDQNLKYKKMVVKMSLNLKFGSTFLSGFNLT